jgi:hypothetical protein
MNRTTKKFIDILNEAYRADPVAIDDLVNSRVRCHEDLAEHPTIQVVVQKSGPDELYYVGFLGILNGILESLNGDKIAAMFNENEQVVGFTLFEND